MKCLLTAAAAFIPSVIAFASDSSPAARPNIIVILVDDMGFSDIGCYGSEIPTPNIDRLAAHGLRFTQFYNTSRCCPSRAALLTGLYSHEVGVGGMTEDEGVPGYRGRLNEECVTLAEVLRPAGYFTAMTGKWHVGHDPHTRGFERSLNAPAGGFYYGKGPKAKLLLDGKPIANDDPRLPKDWYATDLWTEFGIRFIDEAMQAKKPFFLYLAHNAPHFPLQAPLDEIARFRGKYKIGWDKLREARHAKQIELGIMDKAWPLSPRPPAVAAWDSLSTEQQDRFDHIMAIYAAVVAHMDMAVGRLVDALEKRGVLNNTVILFMSDNGGNAESGPQGRLDGNTPGSKDSVVFCGQSWATLENTPLRRYKHFNHEGGISTPLVVHWPDRIKDGGALRHQVGHLIDIMPTCVALAGAKYPSQFEGHAIPPMEGKSLLSAFGGKEIPRESLFWEHEGNAAVRVGDWKLVRLGRRGAWELYNLKTDRTELHNIAAEHPDLAGELSAKWDAWAVRTHVRPYPGEVRKDKKSKQTKSAASESD